MSKEKFTLDLKDADVLMGQCLSKDATNLSLSEAVEQCFTTHNAALVIVDDFAFSLFLNNHGQYCYFDSHSRTSKGEHCGDGTAILMCFPTLHQLQLQLFRLTRSLGSRRYELQPIQVYHDYSAMARLANMPQDHGQPHDLHVEDESENANHTSTVQNQSIKASKSSQTSPVVTESECTSETTECDPVHVIQGSLSQADSCFAQYKNKKLSLSNVLTSLTCLQKVHEIERSDVNNVLLEGARLHDKTHSKAFPRDLEKAIPQVLSGTNGKYSVHEIETFEGVLKNARSSRTRKNTSVVEGLHKAFTRSEMLIISLGNYMLSSFKSCDGPYIVFNPNPCNEQGLPVDNGKATVAVCISVE